MSIIRLARHPRDDQASLAFTPPDLAQTMGLFGPARFSAVDGAYELDNGEDVNRFIRFMGHHGHRVRDERIETPSTEKFTGPLPECRHCGQAAARKTADALRFCPACGREWDPVVYQPTPRTETAAVVKCDACGHPQPAKYGFCGACGCTITVPLSPAAHAAIAAARSALAEPMLFGDVIAETPQLGAPESAAS